jgi:hypothetical protein
MPNSGLAFVGARRGAHHALHVLTYLESAVMISQRLVSLLAFGFAALAFVTAQGIALERIFINALAY